MKGEEHRALECLRFEWSPTQEDVWASPEAHVAGLNRDAALATLAAFKQAKDSRGPSPLGIVLEGQKGVGKTHLLSWIREQVQGSEGYFFLLGTPQGQDFWKTIVQAFIEGLARSATRHSSQLTMLLDGLANIALVSKDHRDQLLGRTTLTSDGLEDFVAKLRYVVGDMGRQCQNTLRALVLLKAYDDHQQDLGDGFLSSTIDPADAEEYRRWHLPTQPKQPQEIASEISRLLALTGPSVLAADQLDPALRQIRRAIYSHQIDDETREPEEVIQLSEEIAHGLMAARETLRRTTIVVSCLTTTWDLIRKSTSASVEDRFRLEPRLQRIPSRTVGMEFVAARFGPKFAAIGFVPPHPTWPVESIAFDDAPDFTPRGLLQRIDAHVRECLRRGEVIPLTNLEVPFVPPPTAISPTPKAKESELEAFDRQFEANRKHAAVEGALDKDLEDKMMPGLLVAGLQAWVREKDEEEQRRFAVFAGAGGSNAVHATLRESYDADMEDYGFWYFRGLSRPHHAAVLPRLERVMSLAALDPKVPHRRAIVLRNMPWPHGPACRAKREKFESLGGMLKKISLDDLRTFYALGKMLEEDEPLFGVWLSKRKPASNTGIFTEVFGPSGPGDAPPQSNDDQPDDPKPGPAGLAIDPIDPPDENPPAPGHVAPSLEDAVPLGISVDDGQTAMLDLQALRKHVAIFAGSGSGKTVLIRRLIEECALRGISTIALDPNNDLARLGDAWPSPPPSWGQGDRQRASEYLAQTDVVIWTPRRESGRPLSLQPLPDFKAVLDDPDEFELALDSAVAALAPRARVDRNTSKMDRGRAVLREALSYYARKGGSNLNGFVDLLADLPEGVIPLDKASDIAYDMAQTLTAAMINDPLFGGSGIPLDPGVLLTPAPGKRARISVISMIGLPTNEQRQSFVNQLQMALFAWIKLNPANDRPLGGLFVMDEAQTLAPSGAMTACTESTLALASQARKYGLGLIFATQAPRGIHNRIVGNAATQFYGFLNSPVQISAAKELAQAKGGAAMEISQLTAGQFYSMGVEIPFRKLATPMCLSHHPSGALTPEEVLERAKSS